MENKFSIGMVTLAVAIGVGCGSGGGMGGYGGGTGGGGGATCTLASATAAFDSGTLSQGHTFSQTFMTAGTYDYHCTFHVSSGMVGKVIVQ